MEKKKQQSRQKKTDITLMDVVVHMQHMENRLVKKIDDVEEKLGKRIDNVEHGLGKRIDKLEHRLDEVEETLTKRIDALDEDLNATIKDTLTIRRHVGMAVPDED